MITEQLIQKYPIISEQVSRERLRVLLDGFEHVLAQGIAGDIVEFGCYIGTTSVFLRRMLDAYQQSETRVLHVYDSFAGLPPKNELDNSVVGEQFKAGELSVSKKQLLREFHKARLQPPVVHKAWFSELRPADVPERIAFGFLDGDFYESIVESLKLVWPRLTPGAVLAVDDFGREALPGAERAIRTFLQGKSAHLHSSHNIAIIQL